MTSAKNRMNASLPYPLHSSHHVYKHRLLTILPLEECVLSRQVRRNDLKIIYCLTVTPLALRLIRNFDGDVVVYEAILCNFFIEEASRDRNGHFVDGACKVIFL